LWSIIKLPNTMTKSSKFMKQVDTLSWTMIVVHNKDRSSRKFKKHSTITHTKICLGRQGLAQKASQTFFDNTSVQQNIVEKISNSFLNFQWLAKTAHVSIFILLFIWFSCFYELQQNWEDILSLNLLRYA